MESRVNEKVKSRKCAGLISLRKKPAAFPNEILSFKKKKKGKKKLKVARLAEEVITSPFIPFIPSQMCPSVKTRNIR